MPAIIFSKQTFTQEQKFNIEKDNENSISDKCIKFGICSEITDISLTDSLPETQPCGTNSYFCSDCVSYYHYLQDSTLLPMGKHPSDEDTFGIWAAFKNYICKPRIRATLGMIAVGAIVSAGIYAAYRFSQERFELDSPEGEENIIKRERRSNDKSSMSDNNPNESIENLPKTNTEEQINILHTHSIMEGISELTKKPNNNISLLLEFKNESCSEKVLDCIFEPNDDTTSHVKTNNSALSNNNILWTSNVNNPTAAKIKVNKIAFENVLACSIMESQCLDSVSVQDLDLDVTRQKIQKESAQNYIRHQVNDVFDSVNEKKNLACVDKIEGRVKISGITSNVVVDLKSQSCRIKRTNSVSNSEPLYQDISDLICIKHLALVSEGIDSKSDVASSIQRTIHFNSSPHFINGRMTSLNITNEPLPLNRESCTGPKLNEDYLRSALTRCPNLHVTDIRASNKIEGKNAAAPSVYILNNGKLVEVFDMLLSEEIGSTIEKIVIIENNESISSSQDNRLLNKQAKELAIKKRPVIHFGGSTNSWLTNTPNIENIESISETLIKESLVQKKITSNKPTPTPVSNSTPLDVITETAQATQPTQPTQPTQAIRPTQAIQPTQPTQPIKLTRSLTTKETAKSKIYNIEIMLRNKFFLTHASLETFIYKERTLVRNSGNKCHSIWPHHACMVGIYKLNGDDFDMLRISIWKGNNFVKNIWIPKNELNPNLKKCFHIWADFKVQIDEQGNHCPNC